MYILVLFLYPNILICFNFISYVCLFLLIFSFRLWTVAGCRMLVWVFRVIKSIKLIRQKKFCAHLLPTRVSCPAFSPPTWSKHPSHCWRREHCMQLSPFSPITSHLRPNFLLRSLPPNSFNPSDGPRLYPYGRINKVFSSVLWNFITCNLL